MGTYSSTWFKTFLHTVSDEQSDAEAAFIERQLPLPRYRDVLDLCCGAGRHAVRLARAGYRVTGADRDDAVLAHAPLAEPSNPRYVVADMRDLSPLGAGFDAVLLLWQSFGQFAAEANDAQLDALAEALVPGGRLVLDIYHRTFFEAHLGTREIERAGHRVVETKTMTGPRLSVVLEYGGGEQDTFDWELFTPSELAAKAAVRDLDVRTLCGGFDEATKADGLQPRFQAVLQKRA